MSQSVRAATGTKVELNGVTLTASEWECDFDPNLADATSFTDGGFTDKVSTAHECKFSVRGFWDFTNHPHSTPPNIVEGASVANLKFYLAPPAADPTYIFPLIIVDHVRVNAVVRDALKLDFDGYNRGTFTRAV